MRYDKKLKEFVNTPMSDDNPDLVVVLKKPGIRCPECFTRVCWSISRQEYIYGSEAEFTILDYPNNKRYYDDSEKMLKLSKEVYRKGITACDSAFYDEYGCLYEIEDPSMPHKLIYDINEHPEYLR